MSAAATCLVTVLGVPWVFLNIFASNGTMPIGLWLVPTGTDRKVRRPVFHENGPRRLSKAAVSGPALAALLGALGVDEARLAGVAKTAKVQLLSKAFTETLPGKQAFVAAWPTPSTHPFLNYRRE